MYGPGAQSDDVLIFKEDGTGRFEFVNWVLCSADLFRWNVTESGSLNLTGYCCLQLDNDAQKVVSTESDFQYSSLSYRIAEEETRSGKRMRVLRLSWKLPASDHYGFVRRDLTGLEEPRFDIK